MADQNEGAALREIALALIVDLGDQRTGRVEHWKPASGRLLLDAARNAVGAEDRHRVFGDLGERLNEAGALGLEAVDHVLVVHDFVAHVNRRAVLLQRALDDLNGADHARAKAMRLRQHNPQWRRHLVHGILRNKMFVHTSPRFSVSALTSRPSASKTFATMPAESRPALAYIAAGLS